MAYLHLLKHYDPENSYPTIKETIGGATVSLWFNSCSKYKDCVKCHNPETWGRKRSLYIPNDEVVEETLVALDEFFPKHLSLLGGDPLENSYSDPVRNNAADTDYILREVRRRRPHTKVICWTGYTWSEVMSMPETRKIMEDKLVDILVDGRFVMDKKVVGHLYGSSNQKVINVPETISSGKLELLPL